MIKTAICLAASSETSVKAALKPNRMASTVRMMEQYLPKALHSTGYTLLFNSMVKLAGTAGLRVEELSHSKSTVWLRNRRSIQNHIGGLHACSMALAAESASGIIVGMNVPDTKIPLLKRMTMDYVRRCQGDIRVTAALPEEDRQRILELDKGEVIVPVEVIDDAGQKPFQAEMVWAWVNKQSSKK